MMLATGVPPARDQVQWPDASVAKAKDVGRELNQMFRLAVTNALYRDFIKSGCGLTRHTIEVSHDSTDQITFFAVRDENSKIDRQGMAAFIAHMRTGSPTMAAVHYGAEYNAGQSCRLMHRTTPHDCKATVSAEELYEKVALVAQLWAKGNGYDFVMTSGAGHDEALQGAGPDQNGLRRDY